MSFDVSMFNLINMIKFIEALNVKHYLVLVIVSKIVVKPDNSLYVFIHLTQSIGYCFAIVSSQMIQTIYLKMNK